MRFQRRVARRRRETVPCLRCPGAIGAVLDPGATTRGGNDAVAAVKVLEAMPESDPERILLLGYSYGATSSLFATDEKTPGAHDTQIAGVIAFYPYCYDNVVPSPPTLVLIGEKDDWMSVGMCQAVKGKPNFDVVVYPGAFHAFASPRGQPIDALGHHIAFDLKAAPGRATTGRRFHGCAHEVKRGCSGFSTPETSAARAGPEGQPSAILSGRVAKPAPTTSACRRAWPKPPG